MATLGARLIADDLPLAGGALRWRAAAIQIIRRRTCVAGGDRSFVIEALGFEALARRSRAKGDVRRCIGCAAWRRGGENDGRRSCAGPARVLWLVDLRPLTEKEHPRCCHQAARFAAAPLAVFGQRGRRWASPARGLSRPSAALRKGLAGRLRRETARLSARACYFGDLRDCTAVLSREDGAGAVVTALDPGATIEGTGSRLWRRRCLKFPRDGLLSRKIFPTETGRLPPPATPRSALVAARAEWPISTRQTNGKPASSALLTQALHLERLLWCNICPTRRR